AVLRTDMAAHKEAIVSLMNQSQEILTDVVDELYLVIHKAVLVVASGDIYPSSLEPTNEKGFDVASLLPSGFVLHGTTNTCLDIAPLPAKLQGHLEEAYDNGLDDDLLKVLGQDHLQKLYSTFLG
ncbi:hypothetical protein BGZ99_003916, partial [Dissophora globulifera]